MVGVVDLVGDSCDELAEGGELLGLDQLAALDPLPLLVEDPVGDVEEGRHDHVAGSGPDLLAEGLDPGALAEPSKGPARADSPLSRGPSAVAASKPMRLQPLVQAHALGLPGRHAKEGARPWHCSR